MKKHTWLEFPDDEKINSFLKFISGISVDHYSVTGSSRVGSAFTKKEIKIAQKDFSAKIVEQRG